MTRTLRQAAWLGLLGICLSGLAAPGVAWSQGKEPAPEGNHEPRHELLYKTINFCILLGALGYVLSKPAAEFFRSRSASIAKGLDEGRQALAAAQAKLQEVAAKLDKLEGEIAAFKDSSLREMEAERLRLQQAGAEEAARILESARSQTETAVRAAKLELKSYAALKSIALAEEMIRERLDKAAQHRLVAQFVNTLAPTERKN